MEIFKLFGSVMVDTDKADQSLQKVDKKAEGLGNTLLKGAQKAGKFAAGLTMSAVGAGSAMLKMASDAADTMDVIDKASQRMKIGAESYQELSHAAELSGVSMSTMEKAAKQLEGTDLNMDQALEQIYAFETAEERSAAAAELFGEKVAYELTPMLNASGEEFEAMREQAHELGLVMSEDAVKSGAELNDALSNVKASISALGTNLGTQLMPIAKEMCDMLIAFLPQIQAVMSQLGPVLTDTLSAILPVLMNLVQSILPPLIELIQALLPVFTLLCETLLPIISALIEGICTFLSTVVIPVITTVVKTIKSAVDSVINFFKNFKTNMKNIWDGIVNVFKTPINAVIGFINKLVSGVVTGINTVIKAMNKLSFDIPDWVPGLGGKKFGFNLEELTAPQIPLLAEGGTLTGSGSVIVGEAGPELLSLPQGASVNPLSEGSDISMLRDEVRELKEELLHAITHRTIEWNDRELGRLVKTYA